MLWRFASALRSSGSAAFFAAPQSSAREVIDTDKTLKAIALILLLFLILVLLCSCASSAKTHDANRFMLVERYRDCNVYVDLQTGVEWIEKTPYTFAPAIDGYGRPMLWPGFDAMEDGAGRTADADR